MKKTINYSNLSKDSKSLDANKILLIAVAVCFILAFIEITIK